MMAAPPMPELVRESLWHLDAEVDKAGWDQPPLMLMLLPSTISDSAVAIQMKPLTGWDYAATRADSAQGALRGLGRVFAQMPLDLLRSGIPENLFALAFVSESWILKVDTEDHEGSTSALRAGVEHTINNDPRRVEARMIYLQPVAGESAMLLHERDGVVSMEQGTDRGEIPRLMAELVVALTR